ncbi:molybdopterin molybdotransferase MoeA [Echinicola sp. CAU 1574]|uniref:Molybdopterin molybdenumtransferase n=1 Tax=Echinicola arenosa TaxID=2774144 RepID=A0ABR9AGV8_9BACT|nr:molybdopterin molybdotransferase MoeA [Echinicola arenosa]MBD8487993.1 molybdopterin molybdotransferase MoeA [Echinicola arenosa]
MINIQKALDLVLSQKQFYGAEEVPLTEAVGRFLAEDIFTDRDAPPFDRVMMDGIAIQLKDLNDPLRPNYPIQGIQAAGAPQMTLKAPDHCLEVMTGAILPQGTDTVIPYEEVEIKEGTAYVKIEKAIKRFVHGQGSDSPKGTLVLQKGKKIHPGDIGILATVGKSRVEVAKVPTLAIISTGDELIEIDEKPLAHQIRKSNVYNLWASLLQEGIHAERHHIIDDQKVLQTQLKILVQKFDVLLLSGGVSMGKFDYLPTVFENLGVQKLFHRVAQRPGKPFWFGYHEEFNTKIFAYPGNPVSTYVNHLFYFKQWLYASLGNSWTFETKELGEEMPGCPNLARFISVNLNSENGRVLPLNHNGSGDLFSLAQTAGFLLLPQREGVYRKGERFSFITIR